MRYQERILLDYFAGFLEKWRKNGNQFERSKMDAIDRNVVLQIICSQCLTALVVSR